MVTTQYVNYGGSNNLHYDQCQYEQLTRESTRPLLRNLNDLAYKFRPTSDYVSRNDVVHVESELRNQTRPSSKCNTYQYNGKKGYRKIVSKPIPTLDNGFVVTHSMPKVTGSGSKKLIVKK